MVDLTIDAEEIRKKLVQFIREETRKAGFEKVIFGLSGGVDSSVVAYLCAQVMGKKNTLALIMPYKTSSPEDLADAGLVIKKLGIQSKTIEITPMIDAYFSLFPETDKLRRGNKMARERMSILYDHSAAERALVVGSSNKSEILLGYGTIYGDLACAINPMGVLYKTQVRQLASLVGVPERIVSKVPSAGLWIGQTDEGELGFTYEVADKILYLLVDKGLSDNEIIKKGFSRDLVEKIKTKIKTSAFKRRLPLIPQLEG